MADNQLPVKAKKLNWFQMLIKGPEKYNQLLQEVLDAQQRVGETERQASEKLSNAEKMKVQEELALASAAEKEGEAAEKLERATAIEVAAEV